MRGFVILASLAAASGAVAETPPLRGGNVLQGIAKDAYDGDGLIIAGIKVRLFGIDAFENTRPRGREAKRFLSGEVKGKFVRCVVQDYDEGKHRPNAICFNEAGKDLSCLVAWHGYAVEWRTKSGGKYTACDRITPLQEMPPPGPAPF